MSLTLTTGNYWIYYINTLILWNCKKNIQSYSQKVRKFENLNEFNELLTKQIKYENCILVYKIENVKSMNKLKTFNFKLIWIFSKIDIN